MRAHFHRLLCCLSLGLVTGAGNHLAAGQVRTERGDSEVSRTYLMEMRAKPWAQIFEWLTDQTGVPFVSKVPPPTGTFTFIAKKGQRYTLGELIDLLNDGLAAHRYVLLRSRTCFRLIPADEPV